MRQDEEPTLASYPKSLRDARGLSLRGAEQVSGISNAFLSQLESGKVKQPSPVVLYKLAELYSVPYETLMRRAGHPVPEGAMRAGQSGPVVVHRLGKVTKEEEQALLDYLGFLRSRARKRGRKK